MRAVCTHICVNLCVIILATNPIIGKFSNYERHICFDINPTQYLYKITQIYCLCFRIWFLDFCVLSCLLWLYPIRDYLVTFAVYISYTDTQCMTALYVHREYIFNYVDVSTRNMPSTDQNGILLSTVWIYVSYMECLLSGEFHAFCLPSIAYLHTLCALAVDWHCKWNKVLFIRRLFDRWFHFFCVLLFHVRE